MNKQSFLDELRKGLSGLPENDTEERLAFYSEMIDDRMEEGFSESEAVAAVGSASEIADRIIAEIPLTKIAKERIKPKRRLKVWEIVMLILGAPLWISLTVGLIAVIAALYTSLWSLIIALWAVFASFAGGFFGGVVSGTVFMSDGNALTGIAMIGAGIVCAGLCIFAFFGCKAATKGVLLLTKRLALRIKNCFIKKEAA